MISKFVYPATVEADEDGFFLATFPDIPEAGTDGKTKQEALAGAQDSLIAALGGYIKLKRDIPPPSEPTPSKHAVSLPSLVTAKLVLYQAMRDAKMTQVALGKRLGVTESIVRRMLDLDHRSHIGQIENALAVLGKRLIVEVRDAA